MFRSANVTALHLLAVMPVLGFLICPGQPAAAGTPEREDAGVGAGALRGVLVDRVIVRFEAVELGGTARPRFIFARILAFEARLEALAAQQRGVRPPPLGYADRDVRAAIERHVTEEILAGLPVEPPLQDDEVRRRAIAAQLSLEQMAGGRQELLNAAASEGMENEDLAILLDRRVRASLYLDRMVAPMLNPSDAELREVLRNEPTPFRDLSFDDVAPQLRRWYVGDRLRTALASFFRSARARIRIVMIHS